MNTRQGQAALFGLFSLCTPLAPDMSSLIGMRILTGLGLGGALPNLVALVSETADENSRSASVADVYSGAPFGGAVASAISLVAGPAQWELTLYLLLNWLPTLLRNTGINASQAAAAQIGFNLGGAGAAVLAGRLLEGRTSRPTVLAVFTALPILLYALAAVPHHFVALIPIVFLLGCTVVAAQAFYYATASANYPTRIRGLGVGSAIAVGRAGAVVGPLLGGLLAASGRDSSELLISVVSVAITGSLLSVLLAWKMPPIAPSEMMAYGQTRRSSLPPTTT